MLLFLKGIWATTLANEKKLNRAFKVGMHSTFILVGLSYINSNVDAVFCDFYLLLASVSIASHIDVFWSGKEDLSCGL